MAQISVFGTQRFRLSDINLNSVFSASSYTSTSTSFRADYAGGFYDLFLGSGFTYDSFGRPIAGTVTGFEAGGASGRFFTIQSVSVPVSSLLSVALTASNTDDINLIIANLSGPDFMVGALGDDEFFGFGGADFLDGGGGNDTLYGGAGADSLDGWDGNDFLFGEDDSDQLVGWLGDDVLNGGGGNDFLAGEQGNDTLDGGPGVDEASYAEDTLAVAANLLGGFAVQRVGQPDFTVDTLIGIENLRGGSGDDFLLGDNNANRLEGLGGGDNLWGFGGNDTLIGGDGNDIIVGGDNDDTLESGLGQDWLYGQGGADTLRATDATVNAFNVLVGGDGNDTLIGGPTGFDYFYGGDGATGGGNDTFVIAPNSGTKVLIDFEVGGVNDVVQLSGTSLTSFAQVQANLSFSGAINGSVLVAGAGTQVWFLGVAPGQLTAGDFLF
jgi:Ca2+-binding RTX toxin-like protein